MFFKVLFALASASVVAAHGGVLEYLIDGTYYKGFTPYNTATGQTTIQRQWATYDPIEDVTSEYMACNNPGTIVDPQLTATVTAGSNITAFWENWPHNTGPVMVYMADCNGDCTSAEPTELDWFKIDEAGLISGTVASGSWAAGEMIENNSSWTSTIPSALPDGNYMIRFETLALHSSYDPQFYMECAQLEVTGGGSGTPSPTVKFPGGYSADDPSISIDIYSQTFATTYTIPGPAVWSD
ncbi:hypothetical protein ACEPAI_2558 [Sanghuangporus weigelae]